MKRKQVNVENKTYIYSLQHAYNCVLRVLFLIEETRVFYNVPISLTISHARDHIKKLYKIKLRNIYSREIYF